MCDHRLWIKSMARLGGRGLHPFPAAVDASAAGLGLDSIFKLSSQFPRSFPGFCQLIDPVSSRVLMGLHLSNSPALFIARLPGRRTKANLSNVQKNDDCTQKMKWYEDYAEKSEIAAFWRPRMYQCTIRAKNELLFVNIEVCGKKKNIPTKGNILYTIRYLWSVCSLYDM